MNPLYNLKQDIQHRINRIPKKNRIKFQCDLLKLIELAQKDDYENYNLV